MGKVDIFRVAISLSLPFPYPFPFFPFPFPFSPFPTLYPFPTLSLSLPFPYPSPTLSPNKIRKATVLNNIRFNNNIRKNSLTYRFALVRN